jgi:cysteine desulfurase
MKDRPVYMDYNATTPIHSEVKKAMIEALDLFGNASSMHSAGRTAHEAIERARASVARLIGAQPEEIIFTGGGSESNNTVLNMIGCGSDSCACVSVERRELITSRIEHPSVLNAAEFLEHRGVPVHYAGVDMDGTIRLDEFRRMLSERTALVSIMLANNEIGTVEDIAGIVRIAHQAGALVHTDAVQAAGKLPLDAHALGVDFLSLSGHKLYGPKGVGVLYVRSGAPFCTFIHGGHQEEGRRAGTYNTPGIIGMGRAAELSLAELPAEMNRLTALRDKLKRGIAEHIPDIRINGHPSDHLPGTLNVSFEGAEGEAILLYMDMAGIQVSTGSACASGSLEPSHVLLATGIGAELAHGSIRFSLGRENSEADVDYVIEKMPGIIERIRKMSTLYAAGRKKAS